MRPANPPNSGKIRRPLLGSGAVAPDRQSRKHLQPTDPHAVLLSGGLIEGQNGFGREVASRTQALLHFGAERRRRVQAATAGHLAGRRDRSGGGSCRF